jgi:uncharacterized membrane protein
MTESDVDRSVTAQRTIAPSTVVWNTVVPALGLALILGASLLPAFAIAGAAWIAIHVLLAPPSRRRQRRSWTSVHGARHGVVRGS